MKKLAASVVFLIAIGVCAPAFPQNSQVYWHDKSQKEAQKLQKQQQKAYNKSLKKQEKMLKKEQKNERKQAKHDARSSHWPHTM